MDRKDSLCLVGRFELKNNSGATVSVDYRDISKSTETKLRKQLRTFSILLMKS